MNNHVPEIEEYQKRLNWYLQEHYPAYKKITSEEWNALFLALMNQGNAQEGTLEKICNEILPPHVTAINYLLDKEANHEERIEELEQAKSETVLKYSIDNIPSTVTYAKNGIKDLLIEFYGETYMVPIAFNTTDSRTGSVLVTDVKILDNGDRVQTEIFKFKEGIVTRQIISNTGTLTHISDWVPINNAYLIDLDERINTNTTDIANIKRDYATNDVVNSKETALQNQITSNRTDINTLLVDYVKKADNLNTDYLTKNELSVSDTGALIQIERLKNITKGITSNPRQSTPIPVVDTKARLFLPQEIASLRDLVSWKNSLLGEALNYSVDFSDFPTNPSAQELQTYLDNKWTSIGGTHPIIDQTTMTDESLPLSYRWYVNENAWIYSHGAPDNLATNNLYNEQGALVTSGSTGRVLGSNKKFHVMYETNGEGTVVGLDALEQNVINNTADISEVNALLTTYKNTNDTRVKAVEDRATNLESRATTIEGILPTKLDKITNTLNMQGLYGRKADGTHNLLGADSNNIAGSIMLRDSNGNAHTSTPTATTHIANKKYVDDADTVLDTAISNLNNALNTEKETRANADTTLSNKIDNDATPHTTASLSLAVASWENKQQSVIISGYDNTKLNTVVPDLDSAIQWANCGINAVSENSNGITFSCATVPTSTLTFKVVSEKVIS